ncbi:N-acetylmuramidase [Nonlabens sp. YIK11]|uniref:glucosaminidase domain-containing protein n=1 Tax=Nonlabens sp. YIK11 TaxID=1453349 RepID=UPI0006DC8508|nr:glucosaminidase domain-containing protein [Nonlabens sp. YIK11]KQC34195.1 N-acetylmuramidase [Nonlabens sp. YIK11]
MKITFKTFLILFLASGLLVSCGSKNKVVTTKKRSRTTKTVKKSPDERSVVVKETDEKVTRTVTPSDKDDVSIYIDNFAADAMKEMQLYKIPASITLAQGILESGSGKGRLAVEANNHFGVKCHTGWTGNKIYHDDDEDQECFRKYKDASYSYRDHSLFLTERSRYRDLFKLDADDYKAWAKGLKDAGYATDRRYPDKLISLIERYRLDLYDAQVLGKAPKALSRTNNDSSQIKHTVVKGDTLYGLATKHNTTVERIKLINGLRDNSISLGSTLLIEPNTKN